MERESSRTRDIAALMTAFCSIKGDREERPDIANLYAGSAAPHRGWMAYDRLPHFPWESVLVRHYFPPEIVAMTTGIAGFTLYCSHGRALKIAARMSRTGLTIADYLNVAIVVPCVASWKPLRRIPWVLNTASRALGAEF